MCINDTIGIRSDSMKSLECNIQVGNFGHSLSQIGKRVFPSQSVKVFLSQNLIFISG